MYLPNLVNRNIDTLWLHGETVDTDHQEMHPLSAYSPAFPGRQHQLSSKSHPVLQSYSNNAFPGHSHYIGEISSQVSSKLDYLKSLRTFGYDEIRPIGFSHTLRESMDDQAHPTETTESFISNEPQQASPNYEEFVASEEYPIDASEEYNPEENPEEHNHLSEDYNTSYLSDDDSSFLPPQQPNTAGDHVTTSQRRFQLYYQQHSPTSQHQRVGSSSLRHEISISDLNDDDWSMDV